MKRCPACFASFLRRPAILGKAKDDAAKTNGASSCSLKRDREQGQMKMRLCAAAKDDRARHEAQKKLQLAAAVLKQSKSGFALNL